MSSPINEILNPLALVLPKFTTAERDLLVAEIGTIIYNSTTDKLNFSISKEAGAVNWEAITSS